VRWLVGVTHTSKNSLACFSIGWRIDFLFLGPSSPIFVREISPLENVSRHYYRVES
jgi:hypothetical protein